MENSLPSLDEAAIKNALSSVVIQPTISATKDDLISNKNVRSITIDNDQVTVQLRFGFPVTRQIDRIKALVSDALKQQTDAKSVTVEIEQKIVAHSVQKSIDAIPGVSNVIAVASGKGGVGKSTTAVNLALALAYEGARVGILDADIYGPSQHTMLGTADQRPELVAGSEKMIEPIMGLGLQSMSIGYLVERDAAMVWRGPMVTQALQQICGDTQWHDLDYLIIDMPPGTGDIHLTLAQQIPVSGAVIVTTPQDIALQDASKGLTMFNKVDIPVLGLVENMATHICSQCGHEEAVFGSGGGARMASDYEVPLLGSLPLDITIREQADTGTPTVAADPESPLAIRYREIALALAARLAQRGKNLSGKFGTIAVENR